jgi:hypothetical protein
MLSLDAGHGQGVGLQTSTRGVPVSEPHPFSTCTRQKRHVQPQLHESIAPTGCPITPTFWIGRGSINVVVNQGNGLKQLFRSKSVFGASKLFRLKTLKAPGSKIPQKPAYSRH